MSRDHALAADLAVEVQGIAFTAHDRNPLARELNLLDDRRTVDPIPLDLPYARWDVGSPCL